MPTTFRCCLFLLWAAAAFGQAARQEIAFINGTATAAEAMVYADGSLKLTGDVVLHAEQLGPENTSATLKAERVTVLIGQDPEGNLQINKMFARGKVDIVAHQAFPEQQETRDLTSQCDYLQYLSEDETLTMETDDADPVEATVEVKRRPLPQPDAKPEDPAPKEQVYTFKLSGRDSVKYLLTKPQAGELELRNEA